MLAEGLSITQAARRLEDDGENVIPEVATSAFQLFFWKFWAPIPWLLELTIVLGFALGDVVQALIFIALLVFNIVLSMTQEARAIVALDLLHRKLTVMARVMRDGEWTMLPSRQLVLGDLVHIRQGDFVPADLNVTSGEVAVDQSALTGESLSVKVGVGAVVYSGSIAVRGEASGVVQATGTATFFGRSAELVSTAQAPGNMERLIFGLVRAHWLRLRDGDNSRLMVSSVADLFIVVVLAWRGWLMTSIGIVELSVVFATSALYLVMGDGLKSGSSGSPGCAERG